MSKEIKVRKELIGQFKVDSGKVMIMDPDMLRFEKDLWTIDDTPQNVTILGKESKIVADWLRAEGREVFAEQEEETEPNQTYTLYLGSLDEATEMNSTIQQYIEVNEVKATTLLTPNENVLDEINFITRGPEMAGELRDAVAVVANTFFSGAIYNVYATYKTRRSGERITKIEIDLVEDMT